MTPQENDLITTLLTRLKAAASGQPKDPEAEGLIRQAMTEQPDMPYYLVQTVLIQDLSLHNAQNRIAELERQMAEAQARPAPTSFLGGLFGRNAPPAPPPSMPPTGPWTRAPQVAAAPPPAYGGQPQYAPSGYGPPMGAGGVMGSMGAGGGGFLRSAAATAAGVAGGALLFEGISSLFGHQAMGGIMGGQPMTPGLGETVVNNYYGGEPGGVAQDQASAGGYDPSQDQDYSGGQDQDYSGGDAGGSDDFSGGGDVSSC